MTNTPKSEAAALPIVAWLKPIDPRDSMTTIRKDEAAKHNGLPGIKIADSFSDPLCRLTDAQAIIDRLERELAGAYELLHATEDKIAALKPAQPADEPHAGSIAEAFWRGTLSDRNKPAE